MDGNLTEPSSTYSDTESIPVLLEYKLSLDELNFNSKPHISMLTVLAEENVQNASGIVQLIEDRIFEAPSHQKLPSLYLIDSIVKAYGKDYSELFSNNLIQVFLCVFEKAEAKVRHDLFKLRTTWNNMFPETLLHDLDIAVKNVDPNWPVRSKKKKKKDDGTLSLDERVQELMNKSPQRSPIEFSSDEEYTGEMINKKDVVVEEEEFELDEEKIDELEELEKVLAKKRQELNKLESLEGTPIVDGRRSITVQTDTVTSCENETQHATQTLDQSTQYRYRKKTKNFLSQFRPPCKNVATYFRIKTKAISTQYDVDDAAPPVDFDFLKADSKSKSKSALKGKEKSALKEYLSALKDDFLPQGYSNHSGMLVRNLYAQRRQSLLCDITLGSEGRHFKAHKAVLAASSDFFHALFISEAVKQASLSYVELQGITAKALTLILDYIYTSVIPLGKSSQIEEIIIAANQLKIQSLMQCCPALREALSKKMDLTGWLISNMKLLSPSDKMPYVLAIENLRGFSSSFYFPSKPSGGASDDENTDGVGDFICHVDRENNRMDGPTSFVFCRKQSPEDLSDYSYDEGDGPKRKSVKDYGNSSKRHKSKKIMEDSSDDSFVEKKSSYDDSPLPTTEAWVAGKSSKRSRPSTSTTNVNDSKVYECMVCHRQITQRNNFQSHCNAHARKGEKPYMCQLCNHKFWKETSLMPHMQKAHPHLTEEQMQEAVRVKVLPPPVPPVEEGPESTSTDFAEMKDENGNLQCTYCLNTFSNDVAMAKHLRETHPNVKLPSSYRYPCEECKQYFKSGAARAAHMKAHLKKKKLKKEMDADYGMASDDDMEENVDDNFVDMKEEEGPNLKLKLYHCEICSEMFSVQCFYKAHMAGHKKSLDDY